MKKIQYTNLRIYKTVLQWRQKALGPLAHYLANHGVTALQVTLFRLLLAIPLFFMVGEWPLWACLLILFNFFLDSLDGVIARIQNKASLKGRVLDLCTDNFYIVPFILGLIWTNSLQPFWGAVYLVNMLLNYFMNYLRFGIEVGKFPFSFSKYFFYAALLFYAIWLINVFDLLLIFWAVFLLVDNIFLAYKLYRS